MFKSTVTGDSVLCEKFRWSADGQGKRAKLPGKTKLVIVALPDDEHVSAADAGAWSELASEKGGFEVLGSFTGGHMYIQEEAHIKSLAADIGDLVRICPREGGETGLLTLLLPKNKPQFDCPIW